MKAEAKWELVPEWQERAACKGSSPSLFFAEDVADKNAIVNEAKALCTKCPVRLACLEYALTHRVSDGVWGGKSPRDRRHILRRRREQGSAINGSNFP